MLSIDIIPSKLDKYYNSTIEKCWQKSKNIFKISIDLDNDSNIHNSLCIDIHILLGLKPNCKVAIVIHFHLLANSSAVPPGLLCGDWYGCLK
jgi:hypothetical protein